MKQGMNIAFISECRIDEEVRLEIMLKKNGGFTLIELVMVIVLLGILAAIAVPRYVDLQTEARLAVLDASVGAIRSAAIIQLAQTRTTNTFASIVAATELDSAIQISGNCANATATHTGGGSRAFSISDNFCSG